jgi:glycosyltransferase involved in cell wall biosynthesis
LQADFFKKMFETPYLQKHQYLPQYINEPPNPDLGMVVVIPAYNEPDLTTSLEALKNCNKPVSTVEVIVVINTPEDAGEEVIQQAKESIAFAKAWMAEHSDGHLKFYRIEALGLPKKHAGVGLARKIGMDEAVRRLHRAGNPKGIIICFDADSTCTADYLQEIEIAFRNNPKATGASIYFEHPIEGQQFSADNYQAILLYELHLRYYIAGLRFAGFPYAFYTIGSSMAVRADVYQKQGGMNKRKAGEDFYFLHKVIPLGNFFEINSTKVIPSPRPSNRVPFGTGRAVNNYLLSQERQVISYHPKCFEILKNLISQLDNYYNFKVDTTIYSSLPAPLQDFLKKEDLVSVINEANANSSSLATFKKRFFSWLDGLKVLKIIHYLRDEHQLCEEVGKASGILLENYLKLPGASIDGNRKLLEVYRRLDRGEFSSL